MSVSKECVKSWSYDGARASNYVTIPKEEDSQTRVLACINNKGDFLAVYLGQFKFKLYSVDRSKNSYDLKQEINLEQELIQNGNEGFKYDVLSDIVTEIRFLGEGEKLHISYQKHKEYYFIDIDCSTNVPEMRKADRFEDKSVFEEGPIYQKMQDTLRQHY